jgi:hypothetical protein
MRIVRLAACHAMSKIIQAEFPEDWPDALSVLCNDLDTILHTGTVNSLYALNGCLQCLKDFIEESLAEEQFYQAGQAILPGLLNLLSNVSTL